MPLRSHCRLTADKREIKDFPKLPSATSFIRNTLPYPPRLIKHIAANTPIIANNNSKLGIDAGGGEGV